MTNLLTLVDDFNTDAKCRELLEKLRWPNGEIETRNQPIADINSP